MPTHLPILADTVPLHLELAALHIAYGVELFRAVQAREAEVFGLGGVEAFTLDQLKLILGSSKEFYKLFHARSIFEWEKQPDDTQEFLPVELRDKKDVQTLGALALDFAHMPRAEWTPTIFALNEACIHFQNYYWPLNADLLVTVQAFITATLGSYPRDGLASVAEDFPLDRIRARMATTVRDSSKNVRQANALLPSLTALPAHRSLDHRLRVEEIINRNQIAPAPVDSLMLYALFARLNLAWGIELADAIAARRLETPPPEVAIDGQWPPRLNPLPMETGKMSLWLTNKDSYGEMLAEEGVFTEDKMAISPKGNVYQGYKRGPLLYEPDEAEASWTPARKRIDAALMHLKFHLWKLDDEFHISVFSLIKNGLLAYPANTPITRIAPHFTLKETQQDILRLLESYRVSERQPEKATD